MVAWPSRINASKPPGAAIVGAKAAGVGADLGAATPAGVLGADLAPPTGADFLAAAAGLTLFEVSDGAAALGASDLAFAVGFFVAMSWLLVQTLLLRCDFENIR